MIDLEKNNEYHVPIEKIEVSEQVAFPQERALVAAVQAEIDAQPEVFKGDRVIQWAMEKGLLKPNDVVMAEVSPTYRCPEACEGCPDSILLLMIAIKLGKVPKEELRADVDVMKHRLVLMHDLGVRHFMFVGGTIDHLPETPALIEHVLGLEGVKASWFSDGIIQIKEDGSRSDSYQENISQRWFNESATHVSMDYAFDGNPFASNLALPPKKGRVAKYKEHQDYSRFFKSQYGVIFARRLIEDGARRVVLNITLSPKNIDQVPSIYIQVIQLQEYASLIQSPTEVLLTFSPWIWRPHQARGDNPENNRSSGGLQIDHMDRVNHIFSEILADEHARIKHQMPRLLANSSGYTELLANSDLRTITVSQEVPYMNGRPEMLQVDPDGAVQLDPMFVGPELNHINSTFGYRDREPRPDKNPFTKYHDEKRGDWFPNIITT